MENQEVFELVNDATKEVVFTGSMEDCTKEGSARFENDGEEYIVRAQVSSTPASSNEETNTETNDSPENDGSDVSSAEVTASDSVI